MSESEAVERNARRHAEALRRAKARNAGPVPAVEETDFDAVAIDAARRVEQQAIDASLNWANGNHVVHPSGPGDIPFSPTSENVAEAGQVDRAGPGGYDPTGLGFGRSLESAPRVDSGLSGIDAIVSHTNGRR